MFTTAAALVGVLLVAVLALGPIVLEALPDRAARGPELAAAWRRRPRTGVGPRVRPRTVRTALAA